MSFPLLLLSHQARTLFIAIRHSPFAILIDFFRFRAETIRVAQARLEEKQGRSSGEKRDMGLASPVIANIHLDFCAVGMRIFTKGGQSRVLACVESSSLFSEKCEERSSPCRLAKSILRNATRAEEHDE